MKIKKIFTSVLAAMAAVGSCAWAATEPENMQQVCDSVVPGVMKEHNAGSACVVVADVQTGTVQAVGEYSAEGVINPIRLQEPTRAAMLIQPLVLLTAVEEGLLSPFANVSCEPLQVTPDCVLNDGRFRYGVLTCSDVIKKSSVPGTARMQVIVKPAALAEQFSRLGLELPASITDNMQEYLLLQKNYMATPMQLAAAYTAIGRQGLYAPLPAKGEPGLVCQRAMKDTTAKAILKAMESCTSRSGAAGRGTAVAAAIPGYRVACKTTTVRYNELNPNSAIAGQSESKVDVGAVLMLPADAPRLLVLLLLKDVRSENVPSGGGTVAAPAVRSIAEQGIKLLQIEPTK